MKPQLACSRYPSRPYRMIALFLSYLASLTAVCQDAPAHTPSSPTVQRIVTLRALGGQVDWSPSQNLIAYDAPDSAGYYQLHVMAPDGSADRCLTCNDPRLPRRTHRGSPTWRPDGHFIVFIAEKASHPGMSYEALPGFGQFCDLWAIALDGGQLIQLTNLPATRGSGVLMPHFSRDGLYLSWTQMKAPAKIFDLSARQTAGYWTLRTARFEATPSGAQLSEIKAYEPVVDSFYENDGFTPDGTGLLFTGSRGGSIWSSDAYILDLASGTIVSRLTNLQYNEHAVYSPDGTHILWMTNLGNGAQGATDWWIMDADGSNKRRLTYFNQRGHPEFRGKVWATDASWSPDGHSFVGYVQGNLLTQTGDIVRVDLNQ
ncbi:MAG: hypothetical protein ABI612_19680 [Betaproteobacteria bacterium]